MLILGPAHKPIAQTTHWSRVSTQHYQYITYIVHVFPALVKILLGLSSLLEVLRDNKQIWKYKFLSWTAPEHAGVSVVCIGHSHVSSLPSDPASTSSAPHTLCAPSPRQRPLADLRSHSTRSVWSRMRYRMWTCRKKIYNNEKNNTRYKSFHLVLFIFIFHSASMTMIFKFSSIREIKFSLKWQNKY